MIFRSFAFVLTYSAMTYAQSAPAAAVTGTYHFTTPMTPRSLREAGAIIRSVASVPQVSDDPSNATVTFSGPEEAVSFASWVLPQIDRNAGDTSVHEYKLPSGEVGRVNFVPSAGRPQDLQELLTILRTVADVQKVNTFSANRAIVLRGQAWQVAFAEWIIEEIVQPGPEKPASAALDFTVGGPDFRGLGHSARLSFLSNMTSPRQMQELFTVIRIVSDVQKIFNYTSGHALVWRAGESDMKRAEWLIQQLDAPTGQVSGPMSFNAAGADDVTKIFRLRNTTPAGLQNAVTGIRSELNIKKIFATTTPAAIVLRGTTDQVASAVSWMSAHNALID